MNVPVHFSAKHSEGGSFCLAMRCKWLILGLEKKANELKENNNKIISLVTVARKHSLFDYSPKIKNFKNII